MIQAKLKASSLPEEARPQKSWGEWVDGFFGFSVRLPQNHWVAVYFDRRLMTGDFTDRTNFLNDHKPIAYTITELGKGWTIYAEPTAPGQLGIVVYTGKGKAIAAGTGEISNIGDFNFAIATLYKGMTNAGKIEYEVKGTGKSDGSWEVTGSVTYSK